jgi:hypothetical protein
MVQMTGHGRDDLAEIIESLATVEEVIRDVAREDPDVRAALGRLASWLAELAAPVTDDAATELREVDDGASPIETADESETAHAEAAREQPLGLTTLRIGDDEIVVEARGTDHELAAAARAQPPDAGDVSAQRPTGEPTSEALLRNFARRCQTKAELCRWVKDLPDVTLYTGWDEAMRGLAPDLHERVHADETLVRFGAMLRTRRPPDARLERLAKTYENTRLMLRLTAGLESRGGGDRTWREQCFMLLAETVSALRVQVLETLGVDDPDQDGAFNWLRERTQAERIYVARHMRLDDPADPAAHDERHKRIRTLEERIRRTRAYERRQDHEVRRIGRLVRLISGGADDAAKYWGKLDHAMVRICDGGISPRHQQLRRLLAPLAGETPIDMALSPTLTTALEASEQWALRQAEAERRREPPEVGRVRRVLEGRRVVIIGGDRREAQEEKLCRQLGLAGVEWVETSPHTSVETFRAPITRDGVAVVLLLIRWSSHSYGEVKQICRDHERALVRVKAGYSLNRIAVEICRQVIDQLEAQHAAEE